MALTVGELLRTSPLDLRPLAGGQGLSKPIRWVHVSELHDPTPWLRGSELLLTTGMGVGKTPAQQRAYVTRLAQAGLAGLGFGTGLSFRTVPKQIVSTADRLSFPVFEVPYDVPFIAITEEVFTRLRAQQYDVLSRALEAEHDLTRAVLDGRSLTGVVASLTRAIHGWVVLLDLHGTSLAMAPASAKQFLDLLRSELRSPRAEELRFSLSMVEAGHHISIQPVAAQGRVEAFLAVGKRDAPSQFDRIVISHALSLLSLELAKQRAVAETERRLKGDLLDQILRGSLAVPDVEQALDRLGFDVSRPVAAAMFAAADTPPPDVAVAAEELLVRLGEPFLLSTADDAVLVVTQPEGTGFLKPLRDALAARVAGRVAGGGGGLVPIGDLPSSVREARYALQVCRAERRDVAEFGDLGTYQLLLSLQDPEALRTFAGSVLGALDRYDETSDGELVASLRAFLDHNARWEAAARDLYVHRHTLRYRMRKVEELTGRRLAAARDRMEFFLALRARDMLEADERRDGLSRPYNGGRAVRRRADVGERSKG